MKKTEAYIFGAISILIAFSGLFQTLVYVYKTPLGFSFPLVHNYEQDFYWYLSLMKQGWEGRFLLTSFFTPEKFTPQFVNTFFPLIGAVGRFTGLSLPITYTLFRIIGGAGLLFSGFILSKLLKLNNVEVWSAFLFMIFGAPWWFIQNGKIHQFGEFWTGFDPILRISWLPHHLIANIMLIVSVAYLINFYNRKKTSSAFISAVSASICGFLNPASLFTFFIAFGSALLLSLVQKIHFPRNSFLNLFLGLIPLSVIFWLYKIQNSVFPWTAFRDWESFTIYPINVIGYLSVLGIVGILALIAIPLVLKERNFSWNLIVGWFLAPFLGLGILTRLLPITNGRYLQSAGYIPAAILASYLIYFFIRKIRKSEYLLLILFIVIVINLPSFWASIDRQMMYVDKNMNNPLVYVSNETMAGIKFLDKVGNIEELVMAFPPPATMIPAFTNKRVMGGHPTFTYNEPEKTQLLNRVYSGVDQSAVDEILTKYGSFYIWINHQGVLNWNEFSGIKKDLVYNNSAVYLYRLSR